MTETGEPSSEKQVKVKFDLEIIEEGYPPISAEYLNGLLQNDGVVRLENTPFFVEGVALGDLVSCTGRPPNLVFDFVLKESDNKSISIIFIETQLKTTFIRKCVQPECIQNLVNFQNMTS
jgi:hypothetical protein